ncbi:lipase member K-like [Harmonia axyridis]|uniref:lipase member K-like n=1 Tax=Harmonia axyridis TaxID=115357 RepID=UPI001E27929C|nr:lipase member K-like [Harmonia axyridis]
MTQLQFKLYILQLVIICAVAKNNVCKNWSDYWKDDMDSNENCTYNPDMYLNTPELLEKYFGEYDVHEIPTDDGYFVTTFRIPRDNSKGAILFRHPAITDSICWIGFGRESIGYYFWKNGYEIWLTNTRGTDFSTKHVNLTIDDYSFWNFSFHDIAIYDLRASLNYIYKFNNNSKPALIAQSMGSTEALIYASLFPEEAKKLCEVFVLHGPPSSFQYSSVKFLGFFRPYLKEYTEREKIGDIMRRTSTISRIVNNLCGSKPDLCTTLYSMFGAGWAPGEQDPLLIPIITSQNPRSLSIKSVLHYCQFFIDGKFNMYDYGEKNMEVYGRFTPPEYPVGEILAPIYLVHSREDEFAPLKDTERLYSKMSNSAKIYGKLLVTGMNHVDTFIGLHRNEKVHNKVLYLLNKIFAKYSNFSFHPNRLALMKTIF